MRGQPKGFLSFRHGPMMLGVRSLLENEEQEPAVVAFACDADFKRLGAGRYDADGKLLQPMWGKENLTGPPETWQVLF